MAGANISNVGLLFTHYLDTVTETLNHASKARSRVKKDNKWTGSHIEWRVHTQRSGAIQYTEDGGAFPVADKQDYTPAKAYRKFLVGTIQLTDGVMATGVGSNVARSVIESEIKGMMRDIKKKENFDFFRDGTGVIATTQTGSSGTTLLVDDARGLWEGVEFDVYNAALSTKRASGALVTSITSDPTAAGYATVTIDAAVTGFSAGDKLVWKNSLNRACTGLQSLIDDSASTFQNVDVSANPHYSSLVMDNGSNGARELTPSLFRRMLAGIMQKSGSESPASGLSVLASPWDLINVEELYEGELRIAPETKVAGAAVASFQSSLGKFNIDTDVDCPYGQMFFCDFDQVYRATQRKLGWRRQGDSIFLRSDQSGVHTATAIEIMDYYIKNRHTSGRLDDLAVNQSTMY
jgi:hypothetical protein